MSIETQLQDLLKEAMRGRDLRTADCVRMIKTKHMERRTAAGFKGPLDDALWLDVIASYQKQLRKAREEYAALGERGAEKVPQIDFEIEVCARFLPKLAGEDEVRVAVKEAIARLGVTGPGQAGKVMGDLMKANKGKFDPAMVKRLAEAELATNAK
ncbi:MAG: GatB/YqeY domain-containing protein [Polyangia bacterium]